MSNKRNPYLNLNEKNDFGFSFSDEEEIVSSTTYANLPEEISDLKNRLHAIREIYLPFLENLNKNPDKPMIKWPNRKEVLDKQIEKLKSITDV